MPFLCSLSGFGQPAALSERFDVQNGPKRQLRALPHDISSTEAGKKQELGMIEAEQKQDIIIEAEHVNANHIRRMEAGHVDASYIYAGQKRDIHNRNIKKHGYGRT